MVNPEVPAFPRVLPSKRVGTKQQILKVIAKKARLLEPDSILSYTIICGHKALDSTEGGLILIVAVKIGPDDIDTDTDPSKRDQESYSMELLLVHKGRKEIDKKRLTTLGTLARIKEFTTRKHTYPSEEKPRPIVKNLDLFFPGLSLYATPPLLEKVKQIPVASQE
ncbi:hypothetical protein M9H77_16564 [Catharanthus roseus]|uniref:Uncharacterized protein n=1 Tax=Catharanthus roseus TaxID=4058 RepID=A0ACC0B252_CATRO|nr:hypothetical protein M9H77_16564 [Catharanthus roseus]